MKKNIALVGIGHWGPNIARSFLESGRAEVRWLCDLNAESLKAISKRFPEARTSTSLEEVLADDSLDAVAIATPTATHFSIASQCLQAGKHVLLEKPLTASSEEGRKLLALAEKEQRLLMVGHVFLFNPGIQTAKQWIDKGELGEILYFSFERTNLGPVRFDVNALWDLTSHDLSILCELMGRPPQSVSAVGQSYVNPKVEDVVISNFSYDNGVLAHIHASWLNPRKVRQMVVVGSEKMLVWNDLDLKNPVHIFEKRVDFPPPSELGDTFLAFKSFCHDGGIYLPNVEMKAPLRRECEHFLDCLESGERPQTDGENGLLIVQLLEAATRSLKQAGVPVACFPEAAELR